MIVKSHRWQKTAIAAAALVGLWGSNAMALSLGRVTVQSALGEPLRAEIEVPDINAEEAASLKTALASPEAFRAAGLDYNAAMSGLQVSLQRRADGRFYIRLSSERAINEPFVDLIVEASWATGRVVRDYTLLFDPPALRQTAPPAPTPAQLAAPSSISRAAPVPLTPAPSVTPPAEPRPSTTQTPPRPALSSAAANGTGPVSVKPGDTAGKIALAVKPVNVSLDQMLVALLRANPAAFVDDNVNRVKAGAILNLPTTQQAQATPAREASRIIVAQSKDFNEFRRKLAGSAPSTPVATAERQASGTVQAKVEDKQPVTTAPDKLTLSKGGAIQGKTAEDQLAKERSAQEAASRAAELAKNINDLSKLGAVSSAAAPGLTASAVAAAAPTAAITVPIPTPPASAPPAASAATSAPVVAVAATPPPTETGLLDALIENPLAPAGAVGLIALLAGLGFYRIRQRKKAAPLDSSYLESSAQADSFFGASGGQSVDTDDNAATGSALLYSASQLDAAGDVDPVAEADVYLAYGRDLQAEEILQEALQANPGRIAIHQKLLEIFAKRRDAEGFAGIATQAFAITQGDGLEWERICELGRSIDPGNALYRPGGQPEPLDGRAASPAPLGFANALSDNAAPAASPPTAHHGSDSVDLDLDFSLDEEPEAPEAPAAAVTKTKTRETDAAPLSVVDLDFGSVSETPEPSTTPEPLAAPAPLVQPAAVPIADAIDFALPDLELSGAGLTEPASDSANVEPLTPASPAVVTATPLASAAPVAAAPAPAAASDFGMLEFDLGSLSLDLGDEPAAPAMPAPTAAEDPLATKLALAEEFSAIGDDDGARALIEEVIAEASGDMKIKAQRALSNL